MVNELWYIQLNKLDLRASVSLLHEPCTKIIIILICTSSSDNPRTVCTNLGFDLCACNPRICLHNPKIVQRK